MEFAEIQSADRWNAAIAHLPGAHALQTWQWGQVTYWFLSMSMSGILSREHGHVFCKLGHFAIPVGKGVWLGLGEQYVVAARH